MGRDEYVHKNIRNVDPEVRQAVVRAAVAESVTISDVVGQTLADAWEMEYELSGGSTSGIGGSTQFVVRIPQVMATRIWMVSRSKQITEGSVVQEVLAERFGVPFAPVRRGGATRRRKVAT